MAVTATWQQRLGRLFTVSMSELNPFRRPASYVSIDIGSSSIKMVETGSTGAPSEIVRWDSTPTPPGAMQNNMVMEPERVGGVVRELLDRQGVRACHAMTAVPGPAVMIKRMTVPARGALEVEDTVLAEAESFIPEDLHNVGIDYHIVGHVEGLRQLDVLVVAAKKDIVESYAHTLRAARLIPLVVDVDYCALQNMYELNYDLAAHQVVALVHIGARYSSMNILKGGRSTFTGDVPVGGRDITEALTRGLGMPGVVAEQLKVGSAAEGVSAQQAGEVLCTATDALIDEIYHALSFFWSAASDERIDVIYLSGGAAHTPKLLQRLAERIGIPVAMADPFKRVTLRSAVAAAPSRPCGAEFAVAVGLSQRRPGDKGDR